MEKKNKKKTKNKKSSGLAWACWLLVLILILLVFLVKKDTIITNLKNTSFFDRVFGSTPEFVENHQSKENKSKKNENKKQKDLQEDVLTLNIPSADSKKITMNDLKADQLEEETNIKSKTELENENKSPKAETNSDSVENHSEIAAENEPENKDSNDEKQKAYEKETASPNQTNSSTTSDLPKKELTLCFVLIDSEGGVSRKEVKRVVNKNDSPLTTALNQLLLGPSPENSAEKGCISLIPEGTKLLSAKVSDGVAYLNFNDAFEFNTYGVEGYKHQLEQIVFTATAFSTVKSVQFLIEGVKEDYLGSEGIWIGSPLTRSSF